MLPLQPSAVVRAPSAELSAAATQMRHLTSLDHHHTLTWIADVNYNVPELSLVRADATNDSVVLKLRLSPKLHNFFASMHGGAIASTVDVATTVAIVASGGFPGVSTSLGVMYVAGCSPDAEVEVVASVLKVGASLALCLCWLKPASRGSLPLSVLSFRGTHSAA